MTDYSMDTARDRFIWGHPEWEIEIQGAEHIARDFDAWIKQMKAAAWDEGYADGRFNADPGLVNPYL